MYIEEVPGRLLGDQYEVLGLGLELCVLNSNTVGLLSSENLHGTIISQPFLFEHISQRN